MVSFVGDLVKGDLGVLEKCKIAVFESKASFVVLNFQKAGKIDIPAVTLVIQIQHVARAKPAKVRLCFLEPALAGALEDRGGLRKEEVSGTLVEALKDFDFALKK